MEMHPTTPVQEVYIFNMLQSIIGVLFGTNNRITIQLDKLIYYTGDEVNNWEYNKQL